VQGPADRRSAGPDSTPAPRRNRTIIAAGLVLCVAGAVAAAYLLGLLDRIGLLS
jgi:hypothetical protein